MNAPSMMVPRIQRMIKEIEEATNPFTKFAALTRAVTFLLREELKKYERT